MTSIRRNNKHAHGLNRPEQTGACQPRRAFSARPSTMCWGPRQLGPGEEPETSCAWQTILGAPIPGLSSHILPRRL
jgi:hypothetical protein